MPHNRTIWIVSGIAVAVLIAIVCAIAYSRHAEASHHHESVETDTDADGTEWTTTTTWDDRTMTGNRVLRGESKDGTSASFRVPLLDGQNHGEGVRTIMAGTTVDVRRTWYWHGEEVTAPEWVARQTVSEATTGR